jgi:hypothetical protein
VLASLRLVYLCFCPFQRGGLSANAFVKINRVHSPKHLSCFDLISHMYIQSIDTSGKRGANIVGVSSLDSTDAE